MTIIFVLSIWLYSGLYAIERWVDEFGKVRLWEIIFFFAIAPCSAIALTITNPPKIFIKINPVVWTKT